MEDYSKKVSLYYDCITMILLIIKAKGHKKNLICNTKNHNCITFHKYEMVSGATNTVRKHLFIRYLIFRDVFSYPVIINIIF